MRERDTLRPRDLVAQGIPADYLDRLHRCGVIEKVGHGVYAWPDTDVTEHHSLAQAARVVPTGVVCLLSALQFHGLTTQAPREVWVAIANKAWAPRSNNPKLRICRFSGDALTAMVEEHVLETVKVRVYSPVKTVADCFKFRNTVGLDVALEALRDCWRRRRRVTMDALWAAADTCRMRNVMRLYVESLA